MDSKISREEFKYKLNETIGYQVVIFYKVVSMLWKRSCKLVVQPSIGSEKSGHNM